VLHARATHVAGLATLLICGLAHAVDERPHVAVEQVAMDPGAGERARPKAASKKKSAAKKIAKTVVALPAEIAGLFLSRGLENPTFAGQRITTSFVDSRGWDIPSNLLLPASPLSRQPDMVELDLSEARMALWLTHDVNVRCDLDRDPAVVRGDQFAVKVALQFRFR